MKNTFYFLLIFIAIGFTACTGGTPQEEAPDTESNDVTATVPEVEEVAEVDYSEGYADFKAPKHGTPINKADWAKALEGHWLQYGFEMNGEMNTMLDIMQNVNTYSAGGKMETIIYMPTMGGDPTRGEGTWELEGDKLIFNTTEDPWIIVEVSDNHFGYNLPGTGVVEGVDMDKVMYYMYRVPAPTF